MDGGAAVRWSSVRSERRWTDGVVGVALHDQKNKMEDGNFGIWGGVVVIFSLHCCCFWCCLVVWLTMLRAGAGWLLLLLVVRSVDCRDLLDLFGS